MSVQTKRIAGVLLVLLLQAAAVRAQWQSGFAVLQIGTGARAAAMGEAFAAVAGDASAPFWNPAGAAGAGRFQAHLAHNEWIQEVSHDAAAVLFPIRSVTFGVHALVVSVPDIEQRYYPSEEPLSTFSAHDVVFGMTFARKFGENLALGGNLRYLNETILSEAASGYSVDLGLLCRTPLKAVTAGVVAQHLGATQEMVTQKITLPHTLRAGIAYALPLGAADAPWLLTADYVAIRHQQSHLQVGAEIRPLPKLALRAGYQTGYVSRDFSAGFGVHLGQIAIDYAWVPFQEELGRAHRFSVSLGS
ncbi:MAG TPA: PorV/PorQ family protein [bacterium]|nr:PorV/PorQ family protein [bacterium]HPR88787.1 PorV/PorQ family protein [bacterium]